MSDSMRPRRRQPTRLPRPWDFPGKSTGVGCRCLLWGHALVHYKLRPPTPRRHSGRAPMVLDAGFPLESPGELSNRSCCRSNSTPTKSDREHESKHRCLFLLLLGLWVISMCSQRKDPLACSHGT